MTPANQNKSDHSKYVYFQPGEVLFVVTHTGESLGQQDFDALITWGNNKAVLDGLNVLARPEDEVISFPAFPSRGQDTQGPGPFVNGPVPLALSGHDRAPRADQLEPHNPFTIVLADVKDKDNSLKYVDSDRLAQFITKLDDSIHSTENPDTPDFSTNGTVLEFVSPNWLSSPSSETGGGGGPGSRPVPFPKQTPPETSEFQFTLPKKLEDFCPPMEERGNKVIVAVLDTAPSLHGLVTAYEKWQKVDPVPNPDEHYPGNPQPPRGPHGLIETLLKPGGPLTVYPASYEELSRMRSVHLKDHNYNMVNHGLFVAGIIHSIAPAAEIHLYEVLNPEGVGDLKSIALGLSKVLSDVELFPEKRVVVNCSLILNIPLLYQSIADLPDEFRAKLIHNWVQHKEKDEAMERLNKDLWSGKDSLVWSERQAKPIQWICNLIYEHNSRVIAAAGNDREPGSPQSQKPQARYLAAFESVVGVGALKKRAKKGDSLEAAEYSDRSDRPEVTGITTFGGEKDESKGVLGVYIGKFPRLTGDGSDNGHDDDEDDEDAARKNNCDWGWWAGTSFAAPTISGVTAAVLSGNPGWTTQKAIETLYDIQAITLGPFGEDILDVTPGSPSTPVNPVSPDSYFSSTSGLQPEVFVSRPVSEIL